MLKAYYVEWKRYRSYEEMTVTDEAAEIIVKKLVRHFTIDGPIELRFRGTRGSRAWRNRITLRHNPSIRTVVHEVAHVVDYRSTLPWFTKVHVRHGTKKWFRLMERIFRYGNKMDWWRGEIERRCREAIKIVSRTPSSNPDTPQ